MPGYVVQVAFIFWLTFLYTESTKPPGYVAPPKEYDPNPPKYEYGYRIQDDKSTQGKDEKRDGIYAEGRYYVKNGTESSQNIKYFADDWGYHPVVEYTNQGPHSKSTTNFVLGEEAIKLKNNQKSIPDDPSDPGKADNLVKSDPSAPTSPPVQQELTQNDPSASQPIEYLQQQFLTTAPEVVKSDDPSFNNLQENEPHQLLIQTPISNKAPILINQPVVRVNNERTTGEGQQTQILPELQQVSQNENSSPENSVAYNDPSNHQIILQSTQPQSLSDSSAQHPQPLYYIVEQQQQPQPIEQPQINIESNNADNLFNPSGQPQIELYPTAGPENQLLYSIPTTLPQNQQLIQIIHPSPSGPTQESQNNYEEIPQPQALIYNPKETTRYVIQEDQNKPSEVNYIPTSGIQYLSNNNLGNANEGGQDFVETAPLFKPENTVVEQFTSPDAYKEFGVKLDNKKITSQTNHKKLIESTKNLVSGSDVININHAQETSTHNGIETSTLQSLLNKFVTPTITNSNKIDIRFSDGISSTTPITPVSETEISLLKEPIVVAESPSDCNDKPVTENNDENKAFFASTSRGSLISSTIKSTEAENEHSDQVIVTPRPVSSLFLAPITAGVQLQHVEEPVFENTKHIEQSEITKGKVQVHVQKTIPYYLGMLEYPSGYAAEYNGLNSSETSFEKKAIENIELGKTLLYFPGSEQPKTEKLVQKQENSQPEITSNHLIGKQLPTDTVHVIEGTQQSYVEKQKNSFIDQQYLQQVPTYNPVVEHQQYTLQTPDLFYHQHYPLGQTVESPIQVTKYVDRPYSFQVPVLYSHSEGSVSHPISVQNTVNQKLPVQYYLQKQIEKTETNFKNKIERKLPVPYHFEQQIDKVGNQYPDIRYTQVQQPYYLQIPGLFSQQKYTNLVHNAYPPQRVQFQYHPRSKQVKNGDHGIFVANPYSYAPQINNYLHPKQDIPINRGHIPSKLKKLNLLVFPGANNGYLPPITKNPADLLHTKPVDSFRYSNAQLNNGYLPPIPSKDCNHNIEASASHTNSYLTKPEEHIGLVPPKRFGFENHQKLRTARSNFDDKSIRLEYGFMPPLIPSLEIDEQGQPIEKDDNKK